MNIFYLSIFGIPETECEGKDLPPEINDITNDFNKNMKYMFNSSITYTAPSNMYFDILVNMVQIFSFFGI